MMHPMKSITPDDLLAPDCFERELFTLDHDNAACLTMCNEGRSRAVVPIDAPRDRRRWGVGQKMNLLAVFDNDGTICDTQEVEGACYAKAIERVTGKSLATLDWTIYEEPTSSAIALVLLAGDPAAVAKVAAMTEPNHSVERTGGSRYAQSESETHRWLPPVAHARR